MLLTRCCRIVLPRPKKLTFGSFRQVNQVLCWLNQFYRFICNSGGSVRLVTPQTNNWSGFAIFSKTEHKISQKPQSPGCSVYNNNQGKEANLKRMFAIFLCLHFLTISSFQRCFFFLDWTRLRNNTKMVSRNFMFFVDSCAGIAMLTFALLMSARMGIFQEMVYKQYGKHSKEALFYNVSVILWTHPRSPRKTRSSCCAISSIKFFFFLVSW